MKIITKRVESLDVFGRSTLCPVCVFPYGIIVTYGARTLRDGDVTMTPRRGRYQDDAQVTRLTFITAVHAGEGVGAMSYLQARRGLCERVLGVCVRRRVNIKRGAAAAAVGTRTCEVRKSTTPYEERGRRMFGRVTRQPARTTSVELGPWAWSRRRSWCRPAGPRHRRRRCRRVGGVHCRRRPGVEAAVSARRWRRRRRTADLFRTARKRDRSR